MATSVPRQCHANPMAALPRRHQHHNARQEAAERRRPLCSGTGCVARRRGALRAARDLEAGALCRKRGRKRLGKRLGCERSAALSIESRSAETGRKALQLSRQQPASAIAIRGVEMHRNDQGGLWAPPPTSSPTMPLTHTRTRALPLGCHVRTGSSSFFHILNFPHQSNSFAISAYACALPHTYTHAHTVSPHTGVPLPPQQL